MVGWAVSAGPAPIPLSLDEGQFCVHIPQRVDTYTHAPMKLLYEFARALHMLLPKQIKVEAINTGRLPKQVCIGTLELSARTLALGSRSIPDEIAKTKYQNSNTGELHNVRKIGVEGLNVIAKHGCLIDS
jgi:hypothetical protein